jgi:hypothetical protein
MTSDDATSGNPAIVWTTSSYNSAWTKQTITGFDVTRSFACYGGGKWLLVQSDGLGTAYAYSSSASGPWSTGTVGTLSYTSGCAYLNGAWVAWGQGAHILYTTNLAGSWSSTGSPGGEAGVGDVDFDTVSGNYIAYISSGFYTAPAITGTWTLTTPGLSGATGYYTASASRNFSYSTNGSVWEFPVVMASSSTSIVGTTPTSSISVTQRTFAYSSPYGVASAYCSADAQVEGWTYDGSTTSSLGYSTNGTSWSTGYQSSSLVIYNVACSAAPFIRKRAQTIVVSGVVTGGGGNPNPPSEPDGGTGATSNNGTLQAFGDSVTVGIGAGFPIPGVNEFQYSFVNVLAGDLGLTASNHGIDGSQCQGQDVTLFQQGVPAQQLSVWLTGYNDMRADGENTASQATYSACLTSMLAYLAIPDTMKVTGQSASNIAFTGTWANDPTYSIGKGSSTAGATATVTLNGAGTLYVVYGGGSGIGGTFTITVDGGFPVAFNAGTCTTTSSGYAPCTNYYRLPGLAAGVHTVLLTETSGALYYEWASIVPATLIANPPNVYVGNCIREPAAGYAQNPPDDNGSDAAVVEFNAIIAADVALLRGDGLYNVVYVDVSDAYNPATEQAGDNIHPGTTGHAAIAAAFYAAIS